MAVCCVGVLCETVEAVNVFDGWITAGAVVEAVGVGVCGGGGGVGYGDGFCLGEGEGFG